MTGNKVCDQQRLWQTTTTTTGHLDISTEHTAAVTSHLQGDCKTIGHLLQHTKEKIGGTQGK